MTEAEVKGPSIDTSTELAEGEAVKYKILKDEVVQLTHTLCTELLEMATFKGERDVIDSHVQYLYDEWKQGRFIWDHVIIATCTLDGTEYRINGQHTAWARLNMPASTTARVRIIRYQVSDEDNLRRLYAVFDRNKGRTAGHIIKSLLAGRSEIEGIFDSFINRLSGGLRFWLFEKQEDYRRQGPNQMAALIQGEYNHLFQQVGLFWQRNQTHTHMRRQSVFAALFATFDKAPTKAHEFWQPVYDGLGLDSKNDPRYVLRELLTNVRVDAVSKGHRALSQEDLYRICISAWNKWRKDERVAQTFRTTDRRYKPV